MVVADRWLGGLRLSPGYQVNTLLGYVVDFVIGYAVYQLFLFGCMVYHHYKNKE